MERFADIGAITAAILAAPTWARLGLAVADPRLRERAALEVAETLAHELHGDPEPDANQLTLAL